MRITDNGSYDLGRLLRIVVISTYRDGRSEIQDITVHDDDNNHSYVFPVTCSGVSDPTPEWTPLKTDVSSLLCVPTRFRNFTVSGLLPHQSVIVVGVDN